MGILVKGKPVQAKPAVQRVGKHRQLTVEQIQKRHPAEPFPPIDTFRSETVEHRLSVASDLKGWVEQRLGELATTIDEQRWLRRQLEDAAYIDHPDRPHAVKRCKQLEDDIDEYASDIAYLEAHVDRIWQSLDVADREPLAQAWVCDATDERIVMNAWTRLAQVGFTWPANTRVSGAWFSCLARPLIEDMYKRGLRDGIPLGVHADPFEEEEDE